MGRINKIAYIIIAVILISCISILIGVRIYKKYPYKTASKKTVPTYSVTWIPDDFSLYRTDNTILFGGHYEWRDQGKGRVLFDYTFNPNSEIHIGETIYSCESMPDEFEMKESPFNKAERVDIKGCPADLYIDNGEYNYLIWVNDDGGMMSLYGNVKPEDMILMAESISK